MLVSTCSRDSASPASPGVGGATDGGSGTSADGASGTSAGGAAGSRGDAPACPASVPENQSACAAEGLDCEFEGAGCCGPMSASCAGGHWYVPEQYDCFDEFTSDTAPCPASLPAASADCVYHDWCSDLYPTCSYSACDSGAGIIVTCTESGWVTGTGCSNDAGPTDAASDVEQE